MQVRINCLLGLVIAVFSSMALADQLLYEPFNYATPNPLIGQTDSAGQSWALAGVTDNFGPQIVQGDTADNLNSLSVPGLMPSVGNAVTFHSGDSKETDTPRIGFANGETVPKAAGNTAFYSLMLRVDPSSTDVGNTGPSGTGNLLSNQGIWFAGMNNNTGAGNAITGVYGALTMHQDPVGSDNFSLGLMNVVNQTTNRTFDDAEPLSKGSTIFVVVGYQFNATGTPDSAGLWINPDIGSFGSATPTRAPDFTLSLNSSASMPTAIASFFLRDNQFDPSLMTVDEVRVGTTWADVTPRDPSLITGDANLDGVLNSADYDALNNGFNNNLTGWANGDFNGDGVINADDFALFQYNFALHGTNTTQVPEPAAAEMLSILALASTASRRRGRAIVHH